MYLLFTNGQKKRLHEFDYEMILQCKYIIIHITEYSCIVMVNIDAYISAELTKALLLWGSHGLRTFVAI